MFLRRSCLLLLALVTLSPTVASARGPLDLLLPFRKRVEANPRKTYWLRPKHGPWLILAANFAGKGSDKQANELVYELRKRYNLTAYLHAKRFDYSKRMVGRGVTKKGKPRRMKHLHDSRFVGYAVLVGDFDNVNEPKLEKTLNRVKFLRPSCLDVKKHKWSTQRLVGLRHLQRQMVLDPNRRKRGQMGNAFATRNPLLPKEYFVPKGLDPLVLDMNRDVKYSLMKNPARYSIRVATFRGKSTMKLNEMRPGNGATTRQLEKAAIKAHDMTMALRRKNIPAWEFHDRFESVVTVGGFNTLGRKMKNGKTEFQPRIVRIFDQFKASEIKLPGSLGAGMQPKRIAGIPFDVQPWPIHVPRQSIGAVYARRSY